MPSSHIFTAISARSSKVCIVVRGSKTLWASFGLAGRTPTVAIAWSTGRECAGHFRSMGLESVISSVLVFPSAFNGYGFKRLTPVIPGSTSISHASRRSWPSSGPPPCGMLGTGALVGSRPIPGSTASCHALLWIGIGLVARVHRISQERESVPRENQGIFAIRGIAAFELVL